ncbi:MAG TPA: alpha/beta hydrolase [Candidatus Eremiobacteraceae bacterium]
MSHVITIPINENGIIFDSDMNTVVQEAIAIHPFGFQDVFVYSHGWSNDANRALDEYNRFSVDLAKQLLILGAAQPPVFKQPPRASLSVGIHWPSEITEDANSPLNALQLFTFYTMEHRADSVGKNAVYSMLRLMLQARAGSGSPLRIALLGHSFGCKVVCAALQDLQTDIANNTIAVEPGTSFNAVLLEPATDNDNLEPGDIYGDVCQLANLRVLMSKSSQDVALTKWFVDAGRLANLFKAPRQALGAAGPTPATVQAFGGASNLSVDQGFTTTDAIGLPNRLIVADLSPVHTARKAQNLYDGGFAGSHSDINFAEIYFMIAGFLFG